MLSIEEKCAQLGTEADQPIKHGLTTSGTIVAEVRQAREELARRFNFDLRAMIADARRRQHASGRKVVSFRRKPVEDKRPPQ